VLVRVLLVVICFSFPFGGAVMIRGEVNAEIYISGTINQSKKLDVVWNSLEFHEGCMEENEELAFAFKDLEDLNGCLRQTKDSLV